MLPLQEPLSSSLSWHCARCGKLFFSMADTRELKHLCIELQTIVVMCQWTQVMCQSMQLRIQKLVLAGSPETWNLELGSRRNQPSFHPNESGECKSSSPHEMDDRTGGGGVLQQTIFGRILVGRSLEVLDDQRDRRTGPEDDGEGIKVQVTWVGGGVFRRVQEGQSKWRSFRTCALRRHEQDIGECTFSSS